MWLTVVYTSGPKLKALHLISSTVEEHERWYKTLKKLRQHRKEVTGGLAFLMSPERKLNPEKSVRVIRRHWREAGGIGKETAEVGFAEVERLCWKLNVHLSSKYLKEKFDVHLFLVALMSRKPTAVIVGNSTLSNFKNSFDFSRNGRRF
jgi:phosphatidylinositol phospholipase C, delta